MKEENQLDLFPSGKLHITLNRLAQQLIERYGKFEDVVFLGIQTKGVFVAKRIAFLLEDSLQISPIHLGELDATFFRDDFRKRSAPLQPNRTKIDFLIEDKKVVLVDDVLYSGRTVRAALDAMLAYGRPESVELLVLVDRQHQREVPIQPSYVGSNVDTIETQWVMVDLVEEEGVVEDKVYLLSKSQE
ncbi:MAG: bifunctional pyr operon transcriptional regulator/uracil phosphoribosyltransferase PyrR [Bacteroidia bacterium]|nr:bifunctional pyr operon transcriptional regulator/uracil phosphoribosyltransferase PyrR [Bacteroidia bacterium]